MSSPEEREALHRIEHSIRRSSELCRVSERELRRAERHWEADVVQVLGRWYGLLTTAIGDGILDDLADEVFVNYAEKERYALREDYANSTDDFDTESEAV